MIGLSLTPFFTLAQATEQPDGQNGGNMEEEEKEKEEEELIRVATKMGMAKGRPGKTGAGKGYYRFTGIPYAEPPVGKLRFMPPVPPPAEAGA